MKTPNFLKSIDVENDPPIKRINQKLESFNFLFLVGDNGVGKTRLLRSMHKSYSDEYKIPCIAHYGNIGFSFIEYWLINLFVDSEKKRLDFVKSIIHNVLSIDVDVRDNHGVIYNGRSFSNLSTGQQTILYLLVDLLSTITKFHKGNLSDFSRVVLLDNLGSNLDPKLQREIPWKLSQCFPNIQFVCTTRSPFVVMGAPEHSLFFKVDKNQEQGTFIKEVPLDIKNLSPNILLSSPLFDVPLLTKLAESKGESIEYRTEYDYQEYQQNLKNTKDFRQLQKKYGDILKKGGS